MRKILLFASIFLVLLVSAFILRTALRPEEARIRRNLNTVAALLSKTGDEPAAAALIRARRVAEYFTGDCLLKANGITVHDSSSLAALVHTARQSADSIRVGLHDVSITVTGENSAEALLTATAVLNGLRRETMAREVRIEFSRRNGSWKIQRAEVVGVLMR